jgi:prepilin-type N-terminal cleavage/methylation domain-containing protein
MKPTQYSSRKEAFTLIELLTVIAIIGILAAIIIPTVGAVKVSANKAKSKVQFNQWAAGIGLFKQDYGFYPYFGTSAPTSDTGVKLSSSAERQMFVDVLSGRKPDGTAISGTALTQNKRRGSYYSFSDSEMSATGTAVDSISDAFGNIQICVVIDYNYDGLITAGFTSVQAGATAAETATSTAYTPDLPTGGVRAGVVIYSPGKGGAKTDIVTSW